MKSRLIFLLVTIFLVEGVMVSCNREEPPGEIKKEIKAKKSVVDSKKEELERLTRKLGQGNELQEKPAIRTESKQDRDDVILRSCWFKKELFGTPDELTIIKDPRRSRCHQTDKGRPTTKLPPVPVDKRNSIRSVAPRNGKKIMALTFDVCEACSEITGFDYKIVSYLREQNVKATFMVGGKWMKSHPERMMQLMAEPLFEIGNHSWSHPDLDKANQQKLLNEILWTQAEYEVLREELSQRPCVVKVGLDKMEQIPRVPKVFRLPSGRCNQNVLDTLASLGLPAIQWDIVTGDPWIKQTAERMEKNVMRNAHPGAIIIFHANGRGRETASALSRIVPRLRNDGYSFATISELLDAGRVVSSDECYVNKPGDNNK